MVYSRYWSGWLPILLRQHSLFCCSFGSPVQWDNVNYSQTVGNTFFMLSATKNHDLWQQLWYDWMLKSCFLLHFLNSFANIGNNHRQWSWDDNTDHMLALTSKSGLICCKCFDVRPATTGCIHFPIFSLGNMHLCFGCNPRDPNGRSVVKKIPNFDEKSPKKPLREVTATPTPISGAYSPEPMIQQEQLDRCYESLQKDSTLVDQCLGSPW